ncbi:hypothetical protein AM588_10010311 [Phytophthora nicotianae]|uniref:Uncharacterized protein n=1 Tax=Phytophthora nicotianae TaxID=4792 RepID=A0A0W8DU18_PHYNI|nr:hypothetical protein AM588_10010311 [Phytophthora nicotianae]
MNNRQGIISNLNPPMLGAIRVKSKVLNLGDPNISNPFPFAFNAVVVDATGVFEVMFFGAMCAKYYLSLHEGDLLSFRGYSSVNPRELQWMATTSPLVSYPNDSSGIVYHVPKKYWKFLELAKIAPRLLADASLSSQQPGSWHLHQLCPSWLECNFVTTLNTQYWGKNAGDLDAMYFDFVGVLSNVGRICRKRKLDEGSSEVTEYRWIKMIDSSSSHELVIKLAEYSQPAVFRSLEAGNTLMITKLQWVILPDKRIQYAKTSTFSVLRMNEAVIPFHSLEECSLNVYFANNVNKNAVLASRKALGESKLSAHIEKKYRPRNRLPTSTEEFKEAFNLDRPAVKGSVKSVTPPKALPLIRLLPTAVVDEMYTKSFNDGPARSTRSKMPTLSLEFVEEYLVSSERGFFFSLQLYRDGIGHVTWEVDAILALP